MVCFPVKNGWQLEHTSTRSSWRVEPTVHSVPHEPQCTFDSKYLGWISAFTAVLSSDAVRAGPRPAGGRRLCPVGSGRQADAATVSSATTRMRFLLLVACSNLTRPV